MFAFEEKLARGTLFSTKKCFGSKQATRVMHKEFNSLCTSIGEKKNRPYLGRRPVPRENPMLNLLGNLKRPKNSHCVGFHSPNYQNHPF